MKKLLLLTLAVSAGLASACALAQSASPSASQPAQAKPMQAKPMQRMDANGDGAISKDEAAKFPRLAASFDQIDTNKDGKLSQDELAAWRKSRAASGDRMHSGYKDPEDMQARRAACFDKADTNHDGQLSRDEFTKMGEVCGMGHGGRGHMPPPAPPAGSAADRPPAHAPAWRPTPPFPRAWKH
ncbi:MAG TPA: EF-hand domain-containing protein [Thermomonas sp.]|nr:EF-hand domain-containing protein [Thermomonas sp.]